MQKCKSPLENFYIVRTLVSMYVLFTLECYVYIFVVTRYLFSPRSTFSRILWNEQYLVRALNYKKVQSFWRWILTSEPLILIIGHWNCNCITYYNRAEITQHKVLVIIKTCKGWSILLLTAFIRLPRLPRLDFLHLPDLQVL